jgi:hypothetical protein
MRVELPGGGSAEFPDDMPQDQIESALAQIAPDKDWQTAGGQVNAGWETLGGPIIAPEEEKSDKPYDPLRVNLTKGSEAMWDRIGANAQAGYRGTLELGSTIAKIADSIGLAPKGTGKMAQDAFNEADKIYQQGTYPETAVSNLIGGLITPAGPTGTAMKLTTMAGGALLKAAPTVGKYIGGIVGGAVSGGITGGLMNTPGNSPDDLWNEDGAKFGAAIGAPVGVFGTLVNHWGQNTAKYQVEKEALDAAEYKGPVLARDYGSEAVNELKSSWMDTILATGVRDEQLKAITPAIKNLLGKVTDETEKQGSHKIGQIVTDVYKKLDNESSQRWEALFNAANSEGISKISVPTAKQTSKQILEAYGKELTPDLRKVLTTMSNAKQFDIRALNKVKSNDIWNMAETFGKSKQAVDKEISQKLRGLYWDITDDIGGAFKGKPVLEEAWKSNREFTRGFKEIFNVKKDRKLMNAINDMNEKGGQLKTFINSVLKPVSGEAAAYRNKALGNEFKDATSELAFNRLFLKAYKSDVDGLDLDEFFKGLKESDASGLLNNDTVKALSTLQQHYNKIKSVQAATQGSVATKYQQHVPFMQIGAVGLGYTLGGIPGGLAAATAVIVGPKALEYISRNSKFKNLLINASKVYGKNPKVTEYLMNAVGRQLPKAGILMTEDGKIDQQRGKK